MGLNGVKTGGNWSTKGISRKGYWLISARMTFFGQDRLTRTIKQEQVDLSEYECGSDAVFHLDQFLTDVYMHKPSTPR